MDVNSSTFADVLERLMMEDKTGNGEFFFPPGPFSLTVSTQVIPAVHMY